MKRYVLPLLLAGALPAADPGTGPAVNAFTTACYKQLARSDGNLILSPFNIATALSMALSGARVRTSDEMRSVLNLQDSAALGSLLSDLTKAGNTGGNELLMANALWVQKGLAILPDFENTLRYKFQAPPTLVDFAGSPEGARSRINSWTDEHTKGKIRDLFPAGSIDAQTQLALTSAIYFYGKWHEPFLTSRTQPSPFMLQTGGTEQVPFMNQTTHFGYTETPGAQILEMGYAGTGIAFDVLLPKTVSGLPDLGKSLTLGWVGQLNVRSVQVSLPRFRAESSFSLGDALSALGMPTAFSDKADFSGIVLKPSLKIGKVAHKAFVDVSEEGTEAAAATGIALRATSMAMPERPIVFRADHPFMFVIRDTRTGVVLFIGRVVNPR